MKWSLQCFITPAKLIGLNVRRIFLYSALLYCTSISEVFYWNQVKFHLQKKKKKKNAKRTHSIVSRSSDVVTLDWSTYVIHNCFCTGFVLCLQTIHKYNVSNLYDKVYICCVWNTKSASSWYFMVYLKLDTCIKK